MTNLKLRVLDLGKLKMLLILYWFQKARSILSWTSLHDHSCISVPSGWGFLTGTLEEVLGMKLLRKKFLTCIPSQPCPGKKTARASAWYVHSWKLVLKKKIIKWRAWHYVVDAWHSGHVMWRSGAVRLLPSQEHLQEQIRDDLRGLEPGNVSIKTWIKVPVQQVVQSQRVARSSPTHPVPFPFSPLLISCDAGDREEPLHWHTSGAQISSWLRVRRGENHGQGPLPGGSHVRHAAAGRPGLQ